MHRFLLGISMIATVTFGGSGVAAASAVGTPTTVLAHTRFDGEPSLFASSLPGCTTGTVSDGMAHVQFNRAHNVFNGAKVFACSSGIGGFTLQVNATFDGNGSTGAWAVIGSWGSQARLTGQGTLVGTLSPVGIDDLYTGSTM